MEKTQNSETKKEEENKSTSMVFERSEYSKKGFWDDRFKG